MESIRVSESVHIKANEDLISVPNHSLAAALDPTLSYSLVYSHDFIR